MSGLIFPNRHGAVADKTAGVTERLSYDAWGKRRNANGSPDTTCSITSAIGKGFTGQEMMDSLCLINMNARIYDPTIGRFLSADPTVPAPFNGQSYNRYTYVLNNPLSLTDPTGLAGQTPFHVQAIDACGSSSGCVTGSLLSPIKEFHNISPSGSEIQSGSAAALTLGGGGNPGGGSGGGYWSFSTTKNPTSISNGIENAGETGNWVFVPSFAGQQFGNRGYVAPNGTNGGLDFAIGGAATGGGNGRTYFTTISANAAIILGADIGVTAYYNSSAHTGGLTFQWGVVGGGTLGASWTGGYQNGGLGAFLSSNEILGGSLGLVAGGEINPGSSSNGGYYGGLGGGFPIGGETGTINVVPLLQVGVQAGH